MIDPDEECKEQESPRANKPRSMTHAQQNQDDSMQNYGHQPRLTENNYDSPI